MEFITNTLYGGVVLIILGILGLVLTFRGTVDFSSGNIKLFMSGVGLIFLGVLILLKVLGYVKI